MKRYFLLCVALGLLLLSVAHNFAAATDYMDCPNSGTPTVFEPVYYLGGYGQSMTNPGVQSSQYNYQIKTCEAVLAVNTSLSFEPLSIQSDSIASWMLTSKIFDYAGFACNTNQQLEYSYFSESGVFHGLPLIDIYPTLGTDKYQNLASPSPYPIIFGGASPVLETVLIMRYALMHARVKRIIIFDVGADELSSTNYSASHDVVNYVASLYGLQVSYIGSKNTFADILETNAQMGIVFSAYNFYNNDLFAQVLYGVGPNNMCNSFIFASINEAYGMVQDQIVKGLGGVPNAAPFGVTLLVSSNHHLAKETQYSYIQEFNTEYSKLGLPSISSDDPIAQLYTVAGWLQASFALNLMTNNAIPACKTGGPYMEFLLNQYISNSSGTTVDNVLWGALEYGNSTVGGGYSLDIFDYHVGGTSVGTSEQQPSCHLGGRFVTLYNVGLSVSSSSVTGIDNTGYSYTASDEDCYFNPSSFENIFLVELFLTSSNLGMNQVTTSFYQKVLNAMPPFPLTKSDHRKQSVNLVAAVAANTSYWAEVSDTLNSQVFIGQNPGFLDMPNRVFLGMVSDTGVYQNTSSLVLSVTPTLQQSVYDMYGLLLTHGKNINGTGTVAAAEVYRARFTNPICFFYGMTSDDQITQLKDMAGKAAEYWNQDAPEILPLSKIKSEFCTTGVNFLQGSIGEEQTIYDLLKGNENASVFLPWSDFIQMYPQLVNTIPTVETDVTARILTSSNLPLWTSTDPELFDEFPILQEFQDTASSSERTPAHFTMFVALKILEAVIMEGVEDLSQKGLLNAVYSIGELNVKGILLTFSDETCTDDIPGSVPCISPLNGGAVNNRIISLNQAYLPTVAVEYPPVMLISETTTLPPLTIPTYAMANKPVTPIGALGKKGLIVGITFVILALVLFIIVLIIRYVTSTERKMKRLLSHLNLSIPLTTVTFSFGDIVNPVLEQEGASSALKVVKRVEKMIRKEVMHYGLVEIENYGTTIVAVSVNPFYALQCCEKVKRGVQALGTELPEDNCLFLPSAVGSVMEAPLEFPTDKKVEEKKDVTIGEMGWTEGGWNEQLEVERHLEFHSSWRKAGMGKRTINVYLKHAAQEGSGKKGGKYINVGSPRVGMGVATGLMERVDDKITRTRICGAGLSLSRLFAAQLSFGEAVMSDTTWYSLSEPEALRAWCGGFFQCSMPSLTTASRSLRDDALTLYRLGEIDALKKQGQYRLYDLNREVSLGMALSLLLFRVEESERIPFLVRLLNFQGSEVPSRPANTNNLMYIATLIDELEACSPF